MFRIVIDALCFQLNPTSANSIFWYHLFESIDEELSREQFKNYSVVVLIRGVSDALRHKEYLNLCKLPISLYDYRYALSDYESLGSMCKSLSANLFISTHYSIAYGVANIGVLNCYQSCENNSIESKKAFLLQSIYLKSLRRHIVFSNSIKSLFLHFDPLVASDSFVHCEPPMLSAATGTVANSVVVASKISSKFPFVLFVDTSIESIFSLLSDCLSGQPCEPKPLPIGIVIHSIEQPPSFIPEKLSNFFEFGIHIRSFKAESIPLLFKSALLFVSHDDCLGFPFNLIYSLYYGCPVACLASPVTEEILSCVKKEDYFKYQLESPGILLDYFHQIINSPYRVSKKTISCLLQKYSLDRSSQFLSDLSDWSSGLESPRDFYLPSILPVDGINLE